MNLVDKVPGLCYRCHDSYVKQGGWVHGPAASGECLLCHNPHKTNNKSLLRTPMPKLCTNCHEPKSLKLVANHSDQSYEHCNVCHAGHISESKKLLKSNFLNADRGLVYISEAPSNDQKPIFVDSKASLTGLRGVEIVPVIDGTDLLKRYGVKKELLEKQVELLLKKNGINTLNPAENTLKRPSLKVYLRLMEVPAFQNRRQVVALSGSLSIFLQQTVELLPAPGVSKRRYCRATTWDTGAIFIWGTPQIEEGLTNAVDVLLGVFIKDYLAANPGTRILTPAKAPQKPSLTDSERTPN